MRAAIYARYSSENQRPESIEDQIASCRKLAQDKGITVDDRHVYSDHATSGSRRDRDGLNALLEASRNHSFDIVLVDDLSRLARDNFFMLSVLADLNFAGINVISVADGLDSTDDESKLGIQIRGIFNELQLQDLKKKTLRGQIGQKKRGYSAGERVFGYKSFPFGETIVDKKGMPRPEGYKFEIEPREADVVLRIFHEFRDGSSIHAIVKALNEDGVPGRNNVKQKWASSTVGRILGNEKYVGKWVWNKSESRRDPKTGRRRRFPKPESEWITIVDESLRIVSQDLWDDVQLRRESMKKSWPGGHGKRGFEGKKGSHEAQYPSHLLSGAMTCATCGATITQVGGKGGGYFGCPGAKKSACSNKVIVRRRLIENVFLEQIREHIASPEQIQDILQRVQKEIQILSQDVPDKIHRKESELSSEERRLANFIDFVGEGRGSRALAKALTEAERKVDELQSELEGLRQIQNRMFQIPPIEWISERINQLSELLEQNTTQSALALREVLGPITLEAKYPDIGKPYYVAHSSLNALAITNSQSKQEEWDKGSSVLRWWARKDSNLRPMDYESIEILVIEVKYGVAPKISKH